MKLEEILIAVESSHVKAVGFEEDGEMELKNTMKRILYGTLYVQFTNGKVYAYPHVSQHDFLAILNAESVGEALHDLGVTSGRGFSVVGNLESADV